MYYEEADRNALIKAMRELSTECICYETPLEQQYVYYGITEPGSALEPNPDCKKHFPDE